jgi:YesN/AraC family two-component response regulator
VGTANHQAEIEMISEAINGQEAILQAAECKPDVIFMDVRMPRAFSTKPNCE